jgi:hypothetical protein
MPVYSGYYSVEPSAKQSWELWVEGSKITYFCASFPPGSQGLLRVAVCYGEKKLYPYSEDQWLRGDNVQVAFYDELPLPETPCRLIVKAENDDPYYPHGFFLYLETELEREKNVRFRVTEDGFVEVEI